MASNPPSSADTRIQSSARSSLIGEVWKSRAILYLITRRDLQVRYAGSMLGIMWNVIHPIVMILIYIMILGTILGGKWGQAGEGSYAVYLCAGIIPWLAFREILVRCSVTLLENSGLIRKVAFPEVVLHLSVLINTVLIHTVSYSAFIVILTLLGRWPGTMVFSAYGVLLAVSLFALGLGLMVSVVNIYFRDIGQLVEIVLQFLFWFTPIVYPLSLIQREGGRAMRLAAALLEWNPLVRFTRFSQWLFGEGDFHRMDMWVIIVLPVVTLFIGMRLFNRFKHDLLDNI